MTYNIYVEFMDGIWEPTCHVVIDNAYNELHRLYKTISFWLLVELNILRHINFLELTFFHAIILIYIFNWI